MALAGADVCEPEEHVPVLVEQFNRQAGAPFELRIAVPTDYEAAGRPAGRPRPVVRGELNPIFQGAYSSRIELKQRTRELERLLTTAEKLGVLLGWLAMPADQDLLWRAWEPMLFNQTHDLMSGVMTDRVYDDTIRGYDFSKRIADDEVEGRWRSLSAGIDTQGEGIPIVVLNTLGWPRTDIVVANVGFGRRNVRDLSLLGPDGQAVPVQVLDSVRYGDGGLLRAEIAFVARDVPPLGYSVYRLMPLRCLRLRLPKPQAEPVLENEHLPPRIRPAAAARSRAWSSRPAQWNALRGPGNVVAREDDHGDLWELYHTLDGGSRIAMKTQARCRSRARPSSAATRARCARHGQPRPGRLRVQGRRIPSARKGQFATTVRLYAGLRRIDIRTRSSTRAVRPLPGVVSHVDPRGPERARDSLRRHPSGRTGIEFPAQNWIDCGNGRRGVALLNRGLPGNVRRRGTMMLSLLRSTRIVAYGVGGGYEPATSSDSGLELGKELTFDYALVPHAGDWRQAGVYRDGLEFNHPLLACTVASHAGTLPSRWGFLEIAPPNRGSLALKPGPDGAACCGSTRPQDRRPRQDSALGPDRSRPRRSISWRTPAASWPWPTTPCARFPPLRDQDSEVPVRYYIFLARTLGIRHA